MATKTLEQKHSDFMRLMTRRLGRALEELRLVSQLSTKYYENTEQEAEEVITHLDRSVNEIATAFAVPYPTAIGAAAERAAQTGHLVTGSKGGKIDEIDIAKAIDLIRRGNSDDAIELLKSALRQEKR